MLGELRRLSGTDSNTSFLRLMVGGTRVMITPCPSMNTGLGALLVVVWLPRLELGRR